MIKELVEKGLSQSFEDAKARVKTKVNEVCRDILYNTAVFKDDEKGRKGFSRFLDVCGIE